MRILLLAYTCIRVRTHASRTRTRMRCNRTAVHIPWLEMHAMVHGLYLPMILTDLLRWVNIASHEYAKKESELPNALLGLLRPMVQI